MAQTVSLAEMNSVFTLILLVIVGILLRRFHVLSAQDIISMRKLVFNIALPALIFISLYSNPIDANVLWIIPGVVIIQALGYVTFRLVPIRFRETIFSGLLGNTGFMGYPVTQAMLGQGALPLAVIYDQTQSFMIFSTWIHRNLRSFINPPLIAMVFALILKRVALPLFFTNACQLVGNTTSPLAMLFVGLNVELDFHWSSLIPAAVKLLLVPALALALTLLLPVTGDIRSTFILQSAMPSLVIGVVYGAQIGLDAKKLSQNVVVSTLLFPLTILFWARFF